MRRTEPKKVPLEESKTSGKSYQSIFKDQKESGAPEFLAHEQIRDDTAKSPRKGDVFAKGELPSKKGGQLFKKGSGVFNETDSFAGKKGTEGEFFLSKKAFPGPVSGAPIVSRVRLATEAEAKVKTNSTVYTFTRTAWKQGGNFESTRSAHSEQAAYLSLGADKIGEGAWICFVQNAPPCSEECRKFFANKSSRDGSNFVFRITADHGGYCKDWKDLKIKPGDTLFCVAGKWTSTPPVNLPDNLPEGEPEKIAWNPLDK